MDFRVQAARADSCGGPVVQDFGAEGVKAHGQRGLRLLQL